MKNRLFAKLGIESKRTKNITHHVLLSFLYKGGHIIAMFLLVPLTIRFLANESYGVWLTISSFIGWFSFFDIGLGNGLRNKFAEARTAGNKELAKGYVSTAYFTITGVAISFMMLVLVITYFLDWSKVFNTSELLRNDLQLLMYIVFGCFSFKLIAKLITAIYTADQNHSIQGKITFLTSSLSLFMIWVLTQTAESSLILYGTIFSLLPIGILLILNLYAFLGPYKEYKPSRRYFKKRYFKDIFGLGLSFFVIQIAVIVMYSTDNFIITQLFGPEEVVPYNIAYKYIGVAQMIFIIILTPYWSGITQAYTNGENDWIKKSMKNLVKISFLSISLIVALVLLAPIAYEIWIDDLVVVPLVLTISMAIYFAISIAYAPFNFFLNGTGKIKIQMYSFATGALLNVPLSIVLVRYLELGAEGVIVATIVCVLPNVILFPIQYKKLISRKAQGIWNK